MSLFSQFGISDCRYSKDPQECCSKAQFSTSGWFPEEPLTKPKNKVQTSVSGGHWRACQDDGEVSFLSIMSAGITREMAKVHYFLGGSHKWTLEILGMLSKYLLSFPILLLWCSFCTSFLRILPLSLKMHYLACIMTLTLWRHDLMLVQVSFIE